ncbi:MAG: SPOR domain-containing protein [Candidatus Omnitrophica bacterium]|nr:SPOR domain-containing protein [Candidatus Omnitrophota bacterium]
MDEKRQAQKELFEEFTEAGEKRKSSKPLFYPRPKRTFTLSYEHIVIVAITVIIVAVVSFSIGVEKGKARHEDIGSAGIRVVKSKASIETKVPPAETEALEEPKPEPAETKPIYTVQVASYKQIEDARKEAEVLEGKGYKSDVLVKGIYYIVCAGEFSTRDKAKTLERKLKAVYKDCYIRER